MNIGYIHLDYGEWTTRSYNIQEIGLAKAWNKWDTKQRLCTGCLPKTGAAERK